ncbi:MAG TPA: chorismate mutase [Chloroflexi bacterium]|jgi:chorismate mutase|nr:chorismate mutase [Chloroflexota bacterium]
MVVRGVRGATTVAANTAEEILTATRALLEEMVAANGIASDDLAAAFFTVTDDLNAAFPARAAREMGWQHVPLMDMREIAVPDSLPRCIRVLLLWNTRREQADIVHLYQGGAKTLRPDLAQDRE